MKYDVAIVGGGPVGSTAGALLKKYQPDLKVVIFEKEKFPREHVGESQLPACSFYLEEMGCWDKVEAANFPIKVGATYLWGKSQEPWDFEFVPLSKFPENQPRPAKFEGARRLTAFQVERARYDEILLDHAEEMGCEVHQETKVRTIDVDGDRIEKLTLADGREVEARYYIDGSGHHGVLRRALDVPTHVPTKLMNIAIWDYWDNAEWATKIGVGGTRVQVLSLPYGWCWFIPLGPTRTSIGLIIPQEYYKQSGKTPEELYAQAVIDQKRVAALTQNATRDGGVKTTKDWSFYAERLAGENWFLAGEAAGFADPILAGGLTLAHESARHAAYAIMEIDHGEIDAQKIKDHYDRANRKRVQQFMRFADFWYAANGQFTDLQDLCSDIAKDAGLNLSPQAAFRWISLGGFNFGDGARPGLGGLDLGAVREVTGIFTAQAGQRLNWNINRFNQYKLELRDAEDTEILVQDHGRIRIHKGFKRGDRVLPLYGVHGHVYEALKAESDAMQMVEKLKGRQRMYGGFSLDDAMATLEIMLLDGWVSGKFNKKRPKMLYDTDPQGAETNFHANEDVIPELKEG